MLKSIYDRIHGKAITMAVYTYILAWDNIIKENESKKKEESDTSDKVTKSPQKSDDILFTADFWKQDSVTYDQMLSYATSFLKRKLKFDSNGKKLPHTIYDTTRKTTYPIQMDIVDYFWETNMVKTMYAEQSIQSKVSRELKALTGMDIDNSILKSDADSAIVCVKRQYKPYAISDKRKAIIDELVQNINEVDEDNQLCFARLKKDVVYLLGNGAVVLFFEDKSHLDGTITFLEKFVGSSFLCDIFEIKSRLILLIDGTKKEIEDAANDLADLVDSAYSAQHVNSTPLINFK